MSSKENLNSKIIKTLKATQFENRINQLEKNKDNVGSLRKKHREFIKTDKSILKT